VGIFSVLEERASPGPGDDFWYEPVNRFSDQEDIDVSTALNQTPVWAAINVIAGTLGSLPLILYKEIANGGKERERGSGLYDMLRWQPNSFQTAVEFIEMGQGHLCLRGNFFARLEVNRVGELTGIVPLHPDKIKLKLVGGGIVEYHYDEKPGQPRVFSSEEILHVKGLSSDGLIGYSPITVGAGAIALGNAAERYGSKFFHNSATPSGILSHPGKLKPEARSNIKKSWHSAHGAGRQHSVALLEEGLAWTALSVSPEEAQFLETRKFQAEEVSRLFNVPPHLLMLLDRSTFSNVVEQNKSFATNTIRPWAIRWEQAIRKSILERFTPDGTFVEFEMSDLLRPDPQARAQANQILLQNGALTIDEWRAKENMNPINEEAGSTHWMPLNVGPISSSVVSEPADEERKNILEEMRSLHIETRADATLQELRSLVNRKKLAESALPKIQSVAQKLLKREVKAVRRMIKKNLAGITDGRELRGTDSLYQDIQEFYFGDFVETINAMMLPVIRQYAIDIYTQATLEVGFPTDLTRELEEFINGYMEVMTSRHAKISRQKLQAIISQADFVELQGLLDIQLERWLKDRAARMARTEATEGNGAFSKYGYMAAGIMSLRWVLSGAETCPYCKRLSGTVVGTMERFVESGDSVKPLVEEGQEEPNPLYARHNVGHPPLHSGCDCFISPSL
jgi:HK97 family phage portal protein